MTEPRQIVGSSKKPRRITAAAEAGAHALTYHGGRLIQNAEVTTIYFGPQWKSDLLKVQLDMFFDFVLTSSLIDQLAEYSSNGMTIGHGSHVASFVLETDPVPTVDNAQVQDLLGQLIAGGSVPAPNANSLYLVFLPSATTGTLDAPVAVTYSVGVSPSSIVADGTTPVTLAVTLTPAGTPPPPPPPPSPGGQAWTVQKEWSNAKGACV